MRTRKKNIAAKKRELFITIFRISIQRVYYNDAFTPYDAQSLNPYASFRIIIAEMKNAQDAESVRRKMVLGDKLG